MDFRLHGGLNGFLAREGLEREGADIIRIAGAAKALVRPAHERDRDFLVNMLRVSYDLHGVRQVYLINHEDCGAYGPEDIPDSAEELAVHRKDLRAARDLLCELYPDVNVGLRFLWLDGRVDTVE
jgi:carbonic anhydrase